MSHKRAIDTIDDPIEPPASKRHGPEPKSPKTSIRDASEALIQAIRKAEEAFQAPLLKTNAIEVRDEFAGSKLKGDTVEAPPEKVYLVREKTFLDETLDDAEIIGCYSNLTDANNKVRNHCKVNAERDDPDADFSERIENGCIFYSWRSETGYGYEVDVIASHVQPAGSEPAQDWGRDIGVECPPKKDSEDEGMDSDDASRSSY